MKVNKDQLIRIRDLAADKFVNLPDLMYHDQNIIVSHDERVSISWLQAINLVLEVEYEFDISYDVSYEDDGGRKL